MNTAITVVCLAVLLSVVSAEESCVGLTASCDEDTKCCWNLECCAESKTCCDQPCGDPRCADPCYARGTVDDCFAHSSDCQWCVAKEGERFPMCANRKNAQDGTGKKSPLHGWACFSSKTRDKIPKKSRIRRHLYTSDDPAEGGIAARDD